MSKHNLEKSLRVELSTLNEIIDKKILRGLSYAREARRHKVVSQSLSSLRSSGWFARPFSRLQII